MTRTLTPKCRAARRPRQRRTTQELLAQRDSSRQDTEVRRTNTKASTRPLEGTQVKRCCSSASMPRLVPRLTGLATQTPVNVANLHCEWQMTTYVLLFFYLFLSDPSWLLSFLVFFFFDNLTLTRNDHTAHLLKHKYTKYTAEAFKCTRPAARYASHLRVHHEFRPPSLLCGIRRHTEHDAAVHTDGRQLEPRSRAASHRLQRWREYPARFLRLAASRAPVRHRGHDGWTATCSHNVRLLVCVPRGCAEQRLPGVCDARGGLRPRGWPARHGVGHEASSAAVGRLPR